MHGTWTREGSILITFLFEVDEKEKYTLALTGWRYLGVLLLCGHVIMMRWGGIEVGWSDGGRMKMERAKEGMREDVVWIFALHRF